MIPVGRDVVFKIQSNDVIHSFWIPALTGKMDAVPGRTHERVMQASEPGLFEGQCTEYCGLSHGVMRMQVKALPQADYDKWVDRHDHAAGVSPDVDELAKAGETLFVAQCALCHQVNGLDPDSKEPFTYAELPSPNYGKNVEHRRWRRATRPNLTHLMMRRPSPAASCDLYEAQGVHRRGGGAGRRAEHQQPQALAAQPGGGQADGSERTTRACPTSSLASSRSTQLVAYLVTLK